MKALKVPSGEQFSVEIQWDMYSVMTAPMSEKEALSLIDALTGHAITQTKEFEKLLNQAVADIHDASLETDERFKDYKEKNALLKFLRRSLKLIQD